MLSFGSRIAGLALLLVALGPLVAGLVFLVAAAIEIGNATKIALKRAEPIVQIAQIQIFPAISRIEAQTESLGDDLSTVRARVEQALSALKDIGKLKIAAGQLGQTPTLRVRLPADDRTFGALRHRAAVLVAMHMLADRASDALPDDTLRFAFGFDPPKPKLPDLPKPSVPNLPKVPDLIPKLKIAAGSILDKDLPTFLIPPSPISPEIPALRHVFAPFGPDGPLGQAFQGTAGELGNTFGEIGKLKDAIAGLVGQLAVLFNLIPYTIPLMLATFFAIQLAVAALLLMCLAATAYIVLRRPREALTSFMLSPLGFVFYCLRAVLIEAVSRCFARPASPAPAGAVADLRRQVDELKAQIALRRANMLAGV